MVLSHKSVDGRLSPYPWQTCAAGSVMGIPSGVWPFRTAARIWILRHNRRFGMVLASSSSRDQTRLSAARTAIAPHYNLASSSSCSSAVSVGSCDRPIALNLQQESQKPICASKQYGRAIEKAKVQLLLPHSTSGLLDNTIYQCADVGNLDLY